MGPIVVDAWSSRSPTRRRAQQSPSGSPRPWACHREPPAVAKGAARCRAYYCCMASLGQLAVAVGLTVAACNGAGPKPTPAVGCPGAANRPDATTDGGVAATESD